MRNVLRELVVALVLLAACSALLAAAPDEATSGLVRKIVVFRQGFVNEPAQAALLRAFQGEPLRSLPLVNGMAVLLPPPAEKLLAGRPEVLRVDEDARVQALGVPVQVVAAKGRIVPQPPQEMAWGVNRIDAEWAWSTSTGRGITVAVIDTGIDARHPDLAANMAGGINFVRRSASKGADPNAWADDNGHGTHVAGIIAALNNSIGVVGVAPDAHLYAIKVLNRSGSGYVSDIITGLQWCLVTGVQVANMSLSTNTDVPSLHDACDLAASGGVILVAAAGNDGAAVDYPAAYPSVIAVGATDRTDARASWSSFGPELDLAAPGVSIKSTWKDSGYAWASGTSMAAPHVAGTLALALAAGLSTDLGASADDLPPTGPDYYSGQGLVDAGEAGTGIVDLGDNLP